jgi:Ca-activated chloride channel family protein
VTQSSSTDAKLNAKLNASADNTLNSSSTAAREREYDASQEHQSAVVRGPSQFKRKVAQPHATVRRIARGLAPAVHHSGGRYAQFNDSAVHQVSQRPVSTFSIDVDTGAYSNVRRFLNAGQLPPRDAVRTEELINYFAYNYPAPQNRARPFSVSTAVAPAPWGHNRHLMRIGIQGFDIALENLPSTNLVFLIDVSGSMSAPNKLGLLKPALSLLTRRLRATDSVSIVVYAGASGVVLEPTPGNQRRVIDGAISRLRAGGSTNGGAGIELAYQLARSAYKPKGINRIVLATDGDFNVGTTNIESLKRLVERKRESGISLSTLGFGRGNFNGALMESIADLGNGNYAYIDTLAEANKVLGRQAAGTLATIAKDVKLQVEFNPAVVTEYRLIGYENRALRREDFNNDRIDAGEIGAGHRVTALYELVFAGATTARVDALRYQVPTGEDRTTGPGPIPPGREIAHLKIRYKEPKTTTSKLQQWPIMRRDVLTSLRGADDDFRFAIAVAGFGQWLRGGRHLEGFSATDITALASQSRGRDALGYRGEFVRLVALAQSLQPSSNSRREQAQRN